MTYEDYFILYKKGFGAWQVMDFSLENLDSCIAIAVKINLLPLKSTISAIQQFKKNDEPVHLHGRILEHFELDGLVI